MSSVEAAGALQLSTIRRRRGTSSDLEELGESRSPPSALFAEKRQEEKKDTFAEKLATQVIKNLQVKVSSIHLRYEDDVSSEEAQAQMTLK